MKTRFLLTGCAFLICACVLSVTPAAAVPDDPGTTWNAYVGTMIEDAPLALERGHSIINQLELQGYDVDGLKHTYLHAKYHLARGIACYQQGITSVTGNPIFQCKADLGCLTGQIQDLTGASVYTHGMVRALQYCFPSYAEFVAAL